VWLGFSGLAQFWIGLAWFVLVSVRFGFFGFLLIKLKPNRTGWFVKNFNQFFSVIFFSSFLSLIDFSVFLLTPTRDLVKPINGHQKANNRPKTQNPSETKILLELRYVVLGVFKVNKHLNVTFLYYIVFKVNKHLNVTF